MYDTRATFNHKNNKRSRLRLNAVRIPFLTILQVILTETAAHSQITTPSKENTDRAIYACSLGNTEASSIHISLDYLKNHIIGGLGGYSVSEIPSVLGSGAQTDAAKVELFHSIQTCVLRFLRHGGPGWIPPTLASVGHPGWQHDDQNGCWIYNSGPSENETVTWNGPCNSNDQADGVGVLEFRNPTDSETYTGEMRSGYKDGDGVSLSIRKNRGYSAKATGSFRLGVFDEGQQEATFDDGGRCVRIIGHALKGPPTTTCYYADGTSHTGVLDHGKWADSP